MKYILSNICGLYKPEIKLNLIHAYPNSYKDKLQSIVNLDNEEQILGELDLKDKKLIKLCEENGGHQRNETGLFLNNLGIENKTRTQNYKLYSGKNPQELIALASDINLNSFDYDHISLEMEDLLGEELGHIKIENPLFFFRNKKRNIYDSCHDEKLMRPSIIFPCESRYNHFIFNLGQYDKK